MDGFLWFPLPTSPTRRGQAKVELNPSVQPPTSVRPVPFTHPTRRFPPGIAILPSDPVALAWEGGAFDMLLLRWRGLPHASKRIKLAHRVR